jgi:hypothetical protein
MRHNSEKEHQKLLKRRRLWDYFRWYYFHQPGRLKKDHWLKDGCAMCRAMQYEKHMFHKQLRAESRKVITEQLDELAG